MLQHRFHPEDTVHRFSGAKIEGTIPIRTKLIGDFLVQLSLNPSVASIEHLATGRLRGTAVALDAIVVRMDGRRMAFDIADDRALRSIDDEGTFLLTLQELGVEVVPLAASDIRREPRFSNSRLVWSHRDRRVPLGLRMQILQMLFDEGALRVSDVLKGVRCDRDPSPAIMALACADAIEIDLGTVPLGPETVVRARRDRDGI